MPSCMSFNFIYYLLLFHCLFIDLYVYLLFESGIVWKGNITRNIFAFSIYELHICYHQNNSHCVYLQNADPLHFLSLSLNILADAATKAALICHVRSTRPALCNNVAPCNNASPATCKGAEWPRVPFRIFLLTAYALVLGTAAPISTWFSWR